MNPKIVTDTDTSTNKNEATSSQCSLEIKRSMRSTSSLRSSYSTLSRRSMKSTKSMKGSPKFQMLIEDTKALLGPHKYGQWPKTYSAPIIWRHCDSKVLAFFRQLYTIHPCTNFVCDGCFVVKIKLMSADSFKLGI